MKITPSRGFKITAITVVVTVATFAAFYFDKSSHDETWTLYRNSPVAVETRIHVATFDASDGHEYNRDNCEIARSLFQGQPSVSVRYWCEQGQFRK